MNIDYLLLQLKSFVLEHQTQVIEGVDIHIGRMIEIILERLLLLWITFIDYVVMVLVCVNILLPF